MQRPIFIVGEGRSGTTLLRNMLSHHPNLWAVPKESYIFVDKWPQANPFFKAKDFEQRVKAVYISMHRVLPKAKKILSSGEIPAELEEGYQDFINSLAYKDLKKDASHLEIFDQICLHKSFQKGAKRFVEKTPFHLYYSKEIWQSYPQAKIIAIYRDPRAVNASWLKHRQSKSLMGNCLSWQKAMQEIYRLEETASREKFISISFEDLIASPQNCMEKICDFIAEDFDAQMLSEEKINSSYEDSSDLRFNSSAQDRWKSYLSPMQIFYIEKTLVVEMQRNGLEPEQKQLEKNLQLAYPLFLLGEYCSLVLNKLKKFIGFK